jgi:hypothetical protein
MLELWLNNRYNRSVPIDAIHVIFHLKGLSEMVKRSVKKAAKPAKEVVVIARITWKHEDKVCYRVRSSEPLKAGSYILNENGVAVIKGQEYSTVLRNGERYAVYSVWFNKAGKFINCCCPATVHECYHAKQLLQIEAKREHASPVETSATVTETAVAVVEQVSDEAEEEDMDAFVARLEAEYSESSAGVTSLAPTLPRAASVVQQAVSSTQQPDDIGERGVLTTAKGFSLMR